MSKLDIISLAIAANAQGGGEVKFYPEVIMVDRTTSINISRPLTPVSGEQITIEQAIGVDTYAILQPYYKDSLANCQYGKRVLAKCKSTETTESEVTIDNVGMFPSSIIPTVGSTIDTWAGAMGEIGDYIALHLYVGSAASPTYFGWVLTQLTDLQSGAHHYFEVIAVLPSDYDGTLGTQTITMETATFEVITVIDVVAPHEPVQLYKHCIRIYEENNDYIDACLTIYSSNSEPIDTKDKLISVLDEEEKVSFWGNFSYEKSSVWEQATALSLNRQGNDLLMCGLKASIEGETSIFASFLISSYELNSGMSVIYTDTVTPL